VDRTPNSSESSTLSKPPKPPPLASTYVRLALAFGVTVAAGFAPLLGRVGIPGFTAILAVFPVNVQDAVVPFAAFIMALPAVALQFYADDRVSLKRIRRWFTIVLVIIIVAVTVLYTMFTMFVIDVRVPGMLQTVRYVVGSRMVQDCPCIRLNLPIRRCIGAPGGLTVATEDVESCFDEQEITTRKLALSLAYFVVMGGFGVLIGLLVRRRGVAPRGWRDAGSEGVVPSDR
jgi:hypothetical protein